MQADPNYLHDNHIRVYNKEGQELQPEQINWRSLDAMNYRFRQDIGGDFNSLGVVRIDIANPYGVYMHDTPAKGVFGDDFRFVSSGCIRLQNVRDYVAWLLREHAGLGPRRYRPRHRLRRAARREDQPAGAGLLGLCHRLGHARRRHAVPRGHLSARRLLDGAGSAPAARAQRSSRSRRSEGVDPEEQRRRAAPSIE